MNRAVAAMAGVENILEGTIVQNEGGLASVDVQGMQITAITSLEPGIPVFLYIRPEEITFHAIDGVRTSARNEYPCRITKAVPIGPMVRITVDAGFSLTAVITRRSYDDLGLAPGKNTELAFKASAIHVTKR
jgi:molybdopterin-binding protein